MTKITIKEYKEMVLSGVNNLRNGKERINSLNVFPVPDGDTGSNMVSTLDSADSESSDFNTDSIGDWAAKFARGALVGARGNSGVILSQIFKGFSVGLKDKKEATTFDMLESFKQAKEYAYKSVMEPVEGTMLTVIRLTLEHLEKTITKNYDFPSFFKEVNIGARKACDLTPTMLKVLKDAGVTDSGGEGLVLVFAGMLEALEGRPVQLMQEAQPVGPMAFTLGGEEDFEGEFGYCTEYIVELKNPKKFNKEKYSADIEKMGNSVVVVVDDDILKTHVHTTTPGKVFTYAQKYGEFLKLKSENMTKQVNRSQSLKEESTQEIKVSTNKIAVISCNSGTGITNELKELGADVVIEGGQTNNPSMQDFLEAIKAVGSENIVLLPNNSNVILVCQQVVQTVTDKNVIVIPSKTPMQGITALMSYSPENSLADNEELMLEALASVKTGLVSIAIRDTEMNKVKIKKNQYIGIAEKDIVTCKKTKVDAAIDVVKSLANHDTAHVVIWYGEEGSKADAEQIGTFIETNYTCDVEIKNGGQPVYGFIMSFE